MELENYVVKCKKFRDAQAVIWKTEVKIKEAASSREKRYYAQDILLEAETLLSCAYYVAGSFDCLKCHLVSQRYIQEREYLAREEIKRINMQ